MNRKQSPTTSRRARTLAALVTTSLLLAGCAGFDSVGSGSGTRYLAAYRPFSSCTDLTSWMKDAMREQVTAWGLGGGWAVPMLGTVRVGAEGAPVSADASMGTGSVSTTTNVQEAGIDEGDLAENDGRYVYLAVGERLRVIDTTNADVVHTETIPVGDHQLILDAETPGNGNLVVVTNRWDGSEPETLVRHYRVTGGVPALTGVDHLEGSLVSLRANTGKVHIVIRHETGRRLPFVAPVTAGSDAEAAALETNRRVVEELEADDVLPRTFRVEADGTRRPAGPALACERIGTPESYSGLAMTWVASIDLDEPSDGATASAGVVADSEHVYASPGSLYVATVRYAQPGGQTAPIKPEPVRTSIHRFALTGEGAAYRASGSVAGRIISSYSMSEHEELLRVATTTDDAGFGAESMSGIRVLETRGDELALLAEVDGLGRGEQIQGVRFAGDLAFVVTFRQIDPLYTVDLTDPANPRVRGELKIPGFSTWLLPVDGGRLLAFGRSGTDEGAITGVQWSLFSVADLDDPRLLATLGAGENSEAVWDPHAIAFEPGTGMLLAPGETWNAFPEPLPATAVEPLPPDSVRMMPPSDGETSESVDPSVGSTGEAASTSPAMIVPVGEYFANVAKLSGDELVDVGRVRLPTQGRRVMLVDGRIVSVNADGSVTLADGGTLEIVAPSL